MPIAPFCGGWTAYIGTLGVLGSGTGKAAAGRGAMAGARDPGRLDRGIDGGVPRHHNHGHGEQAVALPFLEQRDAVRIRHPDVEQDQIGRALLARGPGLLGVLGQLHHVALVAKDFREQLPDSHFIVHYEYVRHLVLPSCLALTVQILSAIHASSKFAAKFASGANFNSKIDTEAPDPSARLATSIRPPCSSTIFLTIGSPRPVPRAFDVT
jgi:hypothetical protein